MKADEVLREAAELVAGSRADSHGEKWHNHFNIATLWNAFLQMRRDPSALISPADAAMMMALLKIARTQLGDMNRDDYVDGAAYIALAGEIEEIDLRVRSGGGDGEDA